MARPIVDKHSLEKLIIRMKKKEKQPLDIVVSYLQMYFRLPKDELTEPTHFTDIISEVKDPSAVVEAVYIEFNKYLHQNYINLISHTFVVASLDRLITLAPYLQVITKPIQSQSTLRTTKIFSDDYPLNNMKTSFFTDSVIAEKLYMVSAIDVAFAVPEKTAEYLRENQEQLLELVEITGCLSIDLPTVTDRAVIVQILKRDSSAFDKIPEKFMLSNKILAKYVKSEIALSNLENFEASASDDDAHYCFFMDTSTKNRRLPMMIKMIGSSVTLIESNQEKKVREPLKTKYVISVPTGIPQEWVYAQLESLTEEAAFEDLEDAYLTLQSYSIEPKET